MNFRRLLSFLPLMALVTAAVPASAQEIRRIALDGSPDFPAPAQEEGKDGIARIKRVETAGLELYPAAQKPARGTVLVFPGGGYSILAITHEGRMIAKMLNEAGWDAAVLLYHVSAGEETKALALQDAQRALELVQTRGQELGLDTHSIGAMGFSAGGHLAARLGHEATAHPPQFLVLMYPAYLEENGQVLADVAPTKIPVFSCVGGADKWAASARAYAEACRQQGTRCELFVAEGVGHGFGLKEPLPEAVKEWPQKLRAFLETVAPLK